jgi:hypothetical protein
MGASLERDNKPLVKRVKVSECLLGQTRALIVDCGIGEEFHDLLPFPLDGFV